MEPAERVRDDSVADQVGVDVARDAGFPEEELHKISMAVRETVVNAVVHGNRYSGHKRVHLQVSRLPDGMTVTVGDEGNGFDLTTLPDPLAEENLLHQSGRGILLIRAFVDEFDMRRLAAGAAGWRAYPMWSPVATDPSRHPHSAPGFYFRSTSGRSR